MDFEKEWQGYQKKPARPQHGVHVFDCAVRMHEMFKNVFGQDDVVLPARHGSADVEFGIPPFRVAFPCFCHTFFPKTPGNLESIHSIRRQCVNPRQGRSVLYHAGQRFFSVPDQFFHNIL